MKDAGHWHKTKRSRPKQPIYEGIKTRLRRRIESGELPPGTRVASEQALATELSVSRGQVRQALRDLEMEGLLERFRGRGSFVAPREKLSARRNRGETKSLILAYPGLARDNYTYHVQRLVKGFVDEVVARGYHPTFFYVDSDEEAEIRFLKNLHALGVAGLALWPQFRTSQECALVEQIVQSNFPCVLVDRYLPGVDADFVGTANRMAFEGLTRQLIRRGHRAIGYLCRDLADSVMEDRLAGYRYALEKQGIAFRESLVSEGGLQMERVAAFVRRTQSDAVRASAYVCSDNWTAENLVQVSGQRSMAAGIDFEVAALDDMIPQGEPSPPDRVIAVQDGYEVGRQTADLLLQRVAVPSAVFEQRLIRPHFLFEFEPASAEATATGGSNAARR